MDYTITYLPPQISDPTELDAATALIFSGFVQFQGGQTIRDFSITLPDTAFLEIGGNFMATLDNTTLIGGSKYNHS